jgi:hypothetical protein
LVSTRNAIKEATAELFAARIVQLTICEHYAIFNIFVVVWLTTFP